MSNTEKSNRLIADFDGYVQKSVMAKDPYLYAVKHAYENNNLHYNDNIEWLKPIAYKCIFLLAKNTAAYPRQLIRTLAESLMHNDIESMYPVVVSSVLWLTKKEVQDGK